MNASLVSHVVVQIWTDYITTKRARDTCIMFHSSNSSNISSRSILRAARGMTPRTNAETMLRQSNLNRIMANICAHGNIVCFAHERQQQHQRHPVQA